jgi:glycine/D-amino acid oxidase-like deaminating enzyme
MGRVPGADGAYVAAGHIVWGMLNGRASGESMAEPILDGTSGVGTHRLGFVCH